MRVQVFTALPLSSRHTKRRQLYFSYGDILLLTTLFTISDQLIRPGMEQAKTPSELRTSVVNYLDYLRDNPVTSDGVHVKES